MVAKGSYRSANITRMHNRDAELTVVGSILTDEAALAIVRSIIVPDDFGDRALGSVYGTMIGLADSGAHIDAITLANALEASGVAPKSVGDMIASISLVPTAAHAKQYAEIVYDLSVRRKLMQYSADVMAMAADETGDATDAVSNAASRLHDLLGHGSSMMVPLSDAVNEYYEMVNRRMDDKDGLWGVPTSLVDLDELTNGLQPGMTVLSGITHHGKTALAVQIAHHAASRGIGVAWFSMEMTIEQMVNRFACFHAKIDSDKVQKGRLTSDDLARLWGGVARVQELPIYICDRASVDQGTFYSELVKLRMRHEIGLVVIDHLHLMQAPKAEREDMALGKLASYIHQRGLDDKLPMLTLAQLNRSVNNRDVKVPTPADLRNSGEIEQVASVIMFVHRQEAIERNNLQPVSPDWKGMAMVLVAKNRLSGRTGHFKARFTQQWGEFQSLARPDDVAPY